MLILIAAVYGGVVLRDKFGTPTHYSTKVPVADTMQAFSTSSDRRKA
jgi:hypothetical protein